MGRARKPTAKIPNACKVPTSGSELGKYSLANTSPVTAEQRRKSYHSMVVPIALAITARASCAAVLRTLGRHRSVRHRAELHPIIPPSLPPLELGVRRAVQRVR